MTHRLYVFGSSLANILFSVGIYFRFDFRFVCVFCFFRSPSISACMCCSFFFLSSITLTNSNWTPLKGGIGKAHMLGAYLVAWDLVWKALSRPRQGRTKMFSYSPMTVAFSPIFSLLSLSQEECGNCQNTNAFLGGDFPKGAMTEKQTPQTWDEWRHTQVSRWSFVDCHSFSLSFPRTN